MPVIQWTEGFSVGVPLMDEQHKRLIDLINATQFPCDERALTVGIAKMFDYAAVHFQAEEALLRSRQYPGLAVHIGEHQQFREKAQDLASRNLRDPHISAQLNAFLCRWLSDHILETDMKYKHFLLPATPEKQ